MKKFSRNVRIICLIVFDSIAIYLMIKYLGYYENLSDKDFGLKYVVRNVCDIGINFNDELIEVFRIASTLKIKLFIAEPQRLVKYLNKEELEILEKCDNISIIEKNFRPNQTILGVLDSDLNQKLFVSLSIFKFLLKIF
jgi:hypothetical protein